MLAFEQSAIPCFITDYMSFGVPSRAKSSIPATDAQSATLANVIKSLTAILFTFEICISLFYDKKVNVLLMSLRYIPLAYKNRTIGYNHLILLVCAKRRPRRIKSFLHIFSTYILSPIL